MSSGTFSSDHRLPVTTGCGSGFSGSWVTKTWSGGDDPKKHSSVNPYTMQYSEVRDGVIEVTYPGSPGIHHSGTWGSCFGGVACDTLTWDSNDDLSLVNKLGDRIRSHEFNAAVSVGAEGKEALEQIARAASSVYSGMRNLRRGNVQGALRDFGINPKHEREVGLHKSLSGKVLATQLGWIPLMSDVSSAYDAVKALTSKPMSMTYHSRRRISSDCHPPSDNGVIAGTHTISKKLTWTLSENFTIWESLSISNPWDFADGVWNATRLSFIADWFLPVGSYLSARSLAHTLKGSGYLSTFDETRTHGVSNFSVYAVKNAEVYFFRNLHVTRTPLASIDGLVALPKFKDFSKIPSWTRALTAVTLATQMFSR